MKIALAQFPVERGDPEANLELIDGYMSQAQCEGATALFLPEMCTTGFGWSRNRELLDGAASVVERVAAMARTYELDVCGSFLERTESDNAANTMFYLDANGQVMAKYRKMHLFTLFNEEQHVEGGREIVTVETKIGRVGCSVCYDLRFPEVFRACALAGAEVQVLAAAFPHPRLSHWQTLIRARAIENQNFLIAVNQCGYEGHGDTVGDIHYFGHSMVVDPWGKVLFEAGEQAGLFVVEINSAEVPEVRKRLTAFADRKPELY